MQTLQERIALQDNRYFVISPHRNDSANRAKALLILCNAAQKALEVYQRRLQNSRCAHTKHSHIRLDFCRSRVVPRIWKRGPMMFALVVAISIVATWFFTKQAGFVVAGAAALVWFCKLAHEHLE